MKLAQAYGIRGHLATCQKTLNTALDEAKKESGSTLIHVALDPDSNVVPVFPIGGSIKDSNGDCRTDGGQK